MNIAFNAIVTHLIAIRKQKSKDIKKQKKLVFDSLNPTKVLSWTRQDFPLGFV